VPITISKLQFEMIFLAFALLGSLGMHGADWYYLDFWQ